MTPEHELNNNAGGITQNDVEILALFDLGKIDVARMGEEERARLAKNLKLLKEDTYLAIRVNNRRTGILRNKYRAGPRKKKPKKKRYQKSLWAPPPFDSVEKPPQEWLEGIRPDDDTPRMHSHKMRINQKDTLKTKWALRERLEFPNARKKPYSGNKAFQKFANALLEKHDKLGLCAEFEISRGVPNKELGAKIEQIKGLVRELFDVAGKPNYSNFWKQAFELKKEWDNKK